uniref:Zmp:0000001301 n=1 Tax=Haplochromis burtoni TaxID=8153 RepID=A0A3Q2VSC2_HAPBU
MALASGHWLEKEIKGEAPSPHGHALAVAGDVAFLFGGACSISQEEGSVVYFSDFYMLTVTWEEIPQSGDVPSAREGHTLVVKGRLYLFGGASSPEATECLPGVYSFDITLTWECLAVGGVALRALRHCSAAAGENIYVYGGAVEGNPTDDLVVFNTSLTWTPVKTSGSLPWGQSCALVGDQVFMFGGYGAGGDFCKDLYVLNTDIYLFGGKSTNEDGTVTSSSEIHKLSIKTKWKVPLYVGIPPTRRHGHTAFILHSHLYVFGGKNEEQNFNDLKVMKLINPSERQPMKEILSEFGLQGISHFTPTKVPNVRYELSEQVFVHRDFSAVRDQAMTMIQTAFTLLDQEFHKLDEKSELTKAAAALQREKDAHEELQEMLDRHRSQNEAWLRARAEENDRERRELCRLRQEEVLQEQERLKEEQSNIQKRSEHLLSIMQQFKGM